MLLLGEGCPTSRRAFAYAGSGSLPEPASSLPPSGLPVFAGPGRFRGPGRHSKSHIVFGVEEGYWLNRGRGKVEGVKR
jgi:hypothetical protein